MDVFCIATELLPWKLFFLADVYYCRRNWLCKVKKNQEQQQKKKQKDYHLLSTHKKKNLKKKDFQLNSKDSSRCKVSIWTGVNKSQLLLRFILIVFTESRILLRKWESGCLDLRELCMRSWKCFSGEAVKWTFLVSSQYKGTILDGLPRLSSQHCAL